MAPVATPCWCPPMVILMPQTARKRAPLAQDVLNLMPRGSNDLNEVLAQMPKSSVSARIPAVHALALKVMAQETGLSLSEVHERLLCVAIAEAIANKLLPAFEDQGPIRLGSGLEASAEGNA